MTGLFSIAYLPPLSYLNNVIQFDEICIDGHEHFIKQSYRNRTNIYGANGKLSLVIPVVHENLFHTPIKDVLISNETNWRKIHWRSISSAYRNSPYFEYFEDDFRNIYESDTEKLFDFNLELFKLIIKSFKLKTAITFSDQYEKTVLIDDLRNKFHPRMINDTQPYYQVFADKHGFIPDLSCLDYLFNCGDELRAKVLSTKY